MNHQPKFEPAATVKDVAEVFARASAFHQAGDLAQAQAGYIAILQQQPGHFGALYMLGVSEQQLGNLQTAERLFRHSLRVDPRSAASNFALGVVVSALQRNDEALACYAEVIALTPDFVDAHMKRGLLLAQLGRFTDAIASYDDAIAIDPRHADAHLLKGEALHYLGRFDDAITCYDRILSTQPDHFGAVVDRACAFKDSGRAVAAIAELDRALLLAPDNTIVLVNRGEARRALNQDAEALEDFDRVIAIDPRNVNAWLGRANILILGRNASEALRASETALALDPNSFKALTLIGEYHASLGDAEAARSFFDRALAIKPDDEAALLNKIFALDFCTGGFAPQQAARSEWWRRIEPKIAVDHPPRHDNDRDPARRITLGYVSGDFRTHSAARVFRPVLQNHDKSRFEIICYYNSFQQDDVTDSFRHVADRWRDVLDWSDERLADHIRADKVDILIDLSGMTFGHRLPVFGRKPAPIQVTAWGHASGTGMPAMDYLFTDPVSVPMEVGDLFAEQIYHLPCSIIIEPPPPGLRAAAPPMISNGYVTYGVFTRASRFSSAAIELWARILRADMSARLIVKDHLLNDGTVRARLLERLAAHGVTPDRVTLMGLTPRLEHLAAYQRVDIGLDPFPHGGGVSTWESLYMGVPVVTKMGNSLSTRIGGAIMTAIDMRDWIAGSDDEYVDIALRSSADRLRTIRQELPDRIAARCGPAAYTQAVETAYLTMWRKYCAEFAG